jgi:hypothetical protein
MDDVLLPGGMEGAVTSYDIIYDAVLVEKRYYLSAVQFFGPFI